MKNIYFLKKEYFKEIENCTIKNIRNIFREIYKRILIPFYIPLLSLLPFLLFLYSKENKNYLKLRVCTFLIGIICVIISETSIRYISANMTYNSIFLILPTILILILYLIFNRKFNIKLIKS